MSHLLGLILQKSAETAGHVGMGKNAECCLRAVGGVNIACPLSNQLGGHPLIAFVCWKSLLLSFPPGLRLVSTALTICKAALLLFVSSDCRTYLFSVSSCTRPSEKKKLRWRQIFSIRGKPLNVLASGCRAAVAAPSEILLQFSVHSLGEAGSGE